MVLLKGKLPISGEFFSCEAADDMYRQRRKKYSGKCAGGVDEYVREPPCPTVGEYLVNLVRAGVEGTYALRCKILPADKFTPSHSHCTAEPKCGINGEVGALPNGKSDGIGNFLLLIKGTVVEIRVEDADSDCGEAVAGVRGLLGCLAGEMEDKNHT